MADTLDEMEKRMRKIRQGWQGDLPEPGSPEFGERARVRREHLRSQALSEKPLSVQGRVKQTKFRTQEHEDILKKAGE